MSFFKTSGLARFQNVFVSFPGTAQKKSELFRPDNVRSL
jgi:hypothetical protein